FQNVQAATLNLFTCGIHGVSGFAIGVAVAGAAADALVTTGAKCPAAVFFTRAIAGEKDGSNIRGTARVVEHAVEFIHRVGAKSVADLRAVKSDAHDAIGAAFASVAVVSDVGEVGKTFYRAPLRRVKRIVSAISSGCSHAL